MVRFAQSIIVPMSGTIRSPSGVSAYSTCTGTDGVTVRAA